MRNEKKPIIVRGKKTKAVRWLLWVSGIAWFGFLVRMSSEDGISTGVTSMRLATFIARLLSITQDQIPSINNQLRVAAHFIGFFIFSCLVHSAAKLTWRSWKPILLFATPVCSALAVLDEVKKLLISGRHLNWPEAGLNVLGVLCGAVVMFLLFQWLTNLMQRRNKAMGMELRAKEP